MSADTETADTETADTKTADTAIADTDFMIICVLSPRFRYLQS